MVSKQKQKLLEFSIKLAGWVLDAPFLIKINKKNMVLKTFIEHFKANLFLPHYDPPPLTHYITYTQDCRDGETKRGDVGLIKVKKQVDFKIHFM